jgi:hypothetical protein
MPGARAWFEELSGLGIRATYRALPGLVEMIMTAPQFATVPQDMVAAMCDWLTNHLNGSFAPAAGGGEWQSVHSSLRAQISAMSLSVEGSAGRELITERAVFLESQAVLFGIVTEPAHREARLGAVILVNAGADYHIGASGIYVGLARRWARRGHIVLRMDLAGLGDSGTRPGQPENVVFPSAAVDDIRVAIEWMSSRYDVGDLTLGGLCSGAYHALRAAANALPVNRILMVNPENFFWNETMSIHDMHLAEIVSEPTIDRDKLFSVGSWKRLLRGQVNIRYILRRAARRVFLTWESHFRDGARRLRIRLPNDLGTELEEIGARGIRIVFVFSSGEPGIALLKMQGGISLQRLGKRCDVHIIEGADHVFSKSGSRAVLEDILTDELFSPMEEERVTSRRPAPDCST